MTRGFTGSPERHGDHWDVRVPVPGTTARRRVHLPESVSSREQATAWARQIVAQLREDALAAPVADTRETVAAWSERWVAARDALGLSCARGDGYRIRQHVLPVLGQIPMAAVTRADLERLVRHLDFAARDGQIAPKTAANAWATVRAMCRDAARGKDLSLRVRDDDPAAGVLPPDRGVRRAKAYLYPSEFLRLMECSAVPLVRRRLYAVTVYAYLRAGEVAALEWSDVDFAHGSIHVHRSLTWPAREVAPTKSRAVRRVPVERELAPLLRAMRRGATDGRLFPRVPDRDAAARVLRADLRAAGISRAELFADDATRCHITAHDLRATGITWAIVRGDDAAKVQRRAGHSEASTTDIYVREVDAFGEAFGAPFPPLPACLVEGDEVDSEVDSGGGSSVISARPRGLEPLRTRAESQDSGRFDTLGDADDVAIATVDDVSRRVPSTWTGHRGDAARALLDGIGAAISAGDLAQARTLHRTLGELLGEGGAGLAVVAGGRGRGGKRGA